jgi:hypothetical protein
MLFFRASPARIADKRAASAFLSACFVLLLRFGLRVLPRLCVRVIDHGQIQRGVIVLTFFLDGLCPLVQLLSPFVILTMTIFCFTYARINLHKR